MRVVSAGEIARMRSTAAETFLDSCRLGDPTSSSWGSDPGSDSYAYGAEIPCGFDMAPAGEAAEGSQAPVVDALLRLPVGTVVSGKHRVRITKRHGEALSPPQDYTVDGEPDRGVSALVLKLQAVTGNVAR